MYQRIIKGFWIAFVIVTITILTQSNYAIAARNSGSAASVLLVGQVFEGSIHLKGDNPRYIPLPPGKWEVIVTKEGLSTVNTSEHIMGGLIKIPERKGDYVTRTLYLFYPFVNDSTGWKGSRRCDTHPSDPDPSTIYNHYLDTDFVDHGAGWHCLLVRAAQESGNNKLFNDMQREILNKGYKIPPHSALLVEYREAGLQGEYQYLQYGFSITDPALIDKAKALKTGPFFPSRVAQFPKRQAYVNALVEWAKDNKFKWRKMMDHEVVNVGPLADPQFPASRYMKATKSRPTGGGALTGAALIQKLKKLKSLFDAGLITAKEFQDEKTDILKNF